MTDKSLETSRVERLIDEFKSKFEARTKDPDNFLTMSELEQLWGDLEQNTKVVYSDMVRSMLAKVNEKELVRKKKRRTPRKASSCAPTGEPAKNS